MIFVSLKNIDLNICAHTWHSVSVMGHKQGFELAVPVFLSLFWQLFCIILHNATGDFPFIQRVEMGPETDAMES